MNDFEKNLRTDHSALQVLFLVTNEDSMKLLGYLINAVVLNH